eukprot:scaffold42364_cov69-Phaeocystis_antarctica.AAC.4
MLRRRLAGSCCVTLEGVIGRQLQKLLGIAPRGRGRLRCCCCFAGRVDLGQAGNGGTTHDETKCAQCSAVEPAPSEVMHEREWVMQCRSTGQAGEELRLAQECCAGVDVRTARGRHMPP